MTTHSASPFTLPESHKNIRGLRHKISVSILALALGSAAQAATVTWDGDAMDGLWSTATNWDGDMLPTAGDDVFISNGDTVTGIQFNSAWTINLSGNSTLADPGVWRAGGSTIIVGAGSVLGSGGFWDLDDATITFEPGASVNMGNWENKDTNNFTFNVGPTGFPALTPNTFRIGNGSMSGSITNATYNVDLSNYTGGPGTITLVDFSNDGASMDDTLFQTAAGLNILNAPSTLGASFIRWNNSAESIEIVLIPEPSRALLLGLGALALLLKRRR